MSESVQDVMDWLKRLDPTNTLAIDDGGLQLIEVGPDGPTGAYYEIGGHTPGSPDLFLEHGGVEVFHTYTDAGSHSECIYTTAGEEVSCNAAKSFDYRELPEIEETAVAKYQELYPDDEVRQRIAQAIDHKLITQDGKF